MADFRPTPIFSLATEPKTEWPWSPKQSFTAGGKPDGNVCRAELDGVEVAQARSARAAGTKLVLRNAVERDECDLLIQNMSIIFQKGIKLIKNILNNILC